MVIFYFKVKFGKATIKIPSYVRLFSRHGLRIYFGRYRMDIIDNRPSLIYNVLCLTLKKYDCICSNYVYV